MSRLTGRPRQPVVGDRMVIDYKDVLDQAVVNARATILREIRQQVERIQVTSPRPHSYSSDNRSARDFQRDVLAALDRLEGDR